MLLPSSLFLLAPLAIATVAVLFGRHRTRAARRARRARLLDRASRPAAPLPDRRRELDGLPIPVRRYFEVVLDRTTPIITRARLRHRGQLGFGDAAPRWRPFVSEQLVVTRRPGFVWDCRTSLLPGLPLRVTDAYLDGGGLLRADLFDCLPVARMQGGADLGRSELLRFLAEAVWYPTALLPSQGVLWEAVGESCARATLADGEHVAALDFTFGADGLVTSVACADRGRAVDGVLVPTPWRGRFQDWRILDGICIPERGEVGYLLPDGERPYWRGELCAVQYEYADGADFCATTRQPSSPPEDDIVLSPPRTRGP